MFYKNLLNQGNLQQPHPTQQIMVDMTLYHNLWQILQQFYSFDTSLLGNTYTYMCTE